MNLELNQNNLCLKRNQVLRVRDGLGHSVVCDSGSVWLTQEGDPRDIVLNAGDAFALDRRGLALLLAFEPGAIRIRQTETPGRAGRLAGFLRSALSGVLPVRGSHGLGI